MQDSDLPFKAFSNLQVDCSHGRKVFTMIRLTILSITRLNKNKLFENLTKQASKIFYKGKLNKKNFSLVCFVGEPNNLIYINKNFHLYILNMIMINRKDIKVKIRKDNPIDKYMALADCIY
jgi:hypothetical protein